jgi:murein DD-endopeptidase MepM/ murein hydrolase activator NlpD
MDFYDDDISRFIRGGAILLVLVVLAFLIFRTRANYAPATVLSGWPGSGQAQQEGLEAHSLLDAAAMSGRGQPADGVRPFGNPLGAANTVMTQEYGIGSHAPAHIWGAIDLALDGNGDGRADPRGTQGRPIYATHSGVVRITHNSWPAGNHVWVANSEYRTGYAHLQSFAVANGQTVTRGTIIGHIGSTGQSSGPHLDYQVWHFRGGAWVNVNPLEYGVFGR